MIISLIGEHRDDRAKLPLLGLIIYRVSAHGNLGEKIVE